mmetsp:Transcript_84971/g.218884  ORF Transcript_84971/g.218884 Transcript_84971/m.218884 type:complete len:264 (-) Transcript_84971:2167-2958(-)
MLRPGAHQRRRVLVLMEYVRVIHTHERVVHLLLGKAGLDVGLPIVDGEAIVLLLLDTMLHRVDVRSIHDLHILDTRHVVVWICHPRLGRGFAGQRSCTHRDPAVPLDHHQPQIARLDGERENRLHLLEPGGAAQQVSRHVEPLSPVVREPHVVLGHPLMRILSALHHNARNRLRVPQVHLEPLALLIHACAPCQLGVQRRAGSSGALLVVIEYRGALAEILCRIHGDDVAASLFWSPRRGCRRDAPQVDVPWSVMPAHARVDV